MSVASEQIDLSVIITCHAEGILIHKTLASVARATALLDAAGLTHETIVHTDNPTTEMNDYLKTHAATTLKDVRLFENSFKDLGSSRNFAIAKAQGEYVATIDADDLMSENWLRDSLLFLKQQSEPTVAHSEVTMEFEGANSLIIKHGEINTATDTLLSVYANRWNSVIVAPRALLLATPYTPNSPGYGYEDWHLNTQLIYQGVHNVLIPETVIFVRRKLANSEWQRQIQSMAVLRANPALSFEHIRSLDDPFSATIKTADMPLQLSQNDLRERAKQLLTNHPIAHKITRRLHHAIKRQRISPAKAISIPKWLETEWRAQHTVERQLFPTKNLLEHIAEYDSLTPEHRIAGTLYKQLVDKLTHKSYDYLFFVPWMIKGGADEFTFNYANAIAKANPKKRVLVVATMAVESPWRNQLDETVDFLDFGVITRDSPQEIKYRLMSHIIENAGVTHLHVINSEFGYDFIRLHKTYLQATSKKIIVTSFSQSVASDGRLYGYSHTHVPFVYDIATLITSDNQAVLKMWEKEYGFDPAKLIVHRQSVKLPATAPSFHENTHRPLRVLWAARISPEKQPELLAEIGRLVSDTAQIDIYGTVEQGYKQSIQQLPPNVIYKRSYDGPQDLPFNDYDMLLYTSLFDGMPNSLLQAAEAGLPIIASAVGGIPELITETTGLLVKDIKNPQAYADAIIKAANDPKANARRAEAAYDILEKEFSPVAYTQKISEFLKKLDY